MTLSRFLRLSAHIQMLPLLESGEETLVGGQAVMEGVMMRAPHSYCVAVRKPDGSLVTEQKPIARMSEKYPWLKFPILRGIGTLGQAMTLGTKALYFSANAALAEEQSAPELTSRMMFGAIFFSVIMMIAVFKFLPLLLATQIGHVVPALSSRFATNMTDGLIRMAILLAYMFAISLMPDIRRVFEYHGAEHKVVFNYESGKPVTVENAQKFVTFHPRCGTSFILVVFALAMIVYALVPVDGFWLKLAVRIALLLPISGLSYEVIRFAAKRQGTFMGALTAPGLWLQRITTKPPDDTQAAVAIHALEGAMALEAKQGGQLVIA
ncbi:MAG TPA: DUF1385 domain-containing protein [Bryobacteraceae bacterium]|nr:DUF1385 domain-containing protein [Bryobacteraceae bacterium]